MTANATSDIRVALYARVSSDEQREGQTIDSQVAELEHFAKNNGWLIIGTYKDEGWSGAMLARPSLDHLRDLASKKLFDKVIINDVDRLARDVTHLGIIKRDFERHGIQVVFRKLPTENSPTANLMINILGSFAEFERELILDRTRRGRRHKLEVRKEYIGTGSASTAYGYRYILTDRSSRKPGYLEIIHEEAKVVRQMYDWADKEALSGQKIVNRLNELKVPTRKGKPWAKSSVMRILRSEMYAGTWHFYKHKLSEPLKPLKYNKYRPLKSSCRLRPRSEWLPLELPEHLRIVDRDQWTRIQNQIVKNRCFSPRNAKHSYLLAGLVRCGGCNATYVGDSKIKQQSFYYRCYKRCKSYPTITEHILDNIVWQTIEEAIINPSVIAAQIPGIKQRNNSDKDKFAANRKDTEQALEQLKNEESRLLEGYRLSIVTVEQLKQEMDKLKNRREVLQFSKDNAVEAKLPSTMIRKHLNDFCSDAAQAIKMFNDEERQQFLRLVIEKIIFEGTQIRIKGVIPVAQKPNDGYQISDSYTPKDSNFLPTNTSEQPKNSQTVSEIATGRIVSTMIWVYGHNPTQEINFDLVKAIPKARIDLSDYIHILKECLINKPNARLSDLCGYLKNKTGVHAGLSTMSRAVKELCLPYKKHGNQGRVSKFIATAKN